MLYAKPLSSRNFLYAALIPPECQNDQNQFSTKGDVFFYGWILLELLVEFPIKKFDKTEIFRKLETKSVHQDLKTLAWSCLDDVRHVTVLCFHF